MVADQLEEMGPEVSKDPPPPLFPMNPPTSDTLTAKVGSSKESKSACSHWLIAPLNPNTPNTPLPKFTKPTTPSNVQMKITPISMTIMSGYWEKNLREADPELEWEKLKRTLLDGLLFTTLGCKCMGSGDTNEKTQI